MWRGITTTAMVTIPRTGGTRNPDGDAASPSRRSAPPLGSMRARRRAAAARRSASHTTSGLETWPQRWWSSAGGPAVAAPPTGPPTPSARRRPGTGRDPCRSAGTRTARDGPGTSSCTDDAVRDERGQPIARGCCGRCPRSPWIASNRCCPNIRLRTISSVHHSPTTSSDRATEQLRCADAGPFHVAQASRRALRVASAEPHLRRRGVGQAADTRSSSMKMHSPGQAIAASITACSLRTRHPRQAARAAGIVQRRAVLGHVGDAVLELHEDVGAVVEAEPVAGAQVLIDPHPHDAVHVPVGVPGGLGPAVVTLGRVTDALVTGPHVAKQIPHTWHRPTGDVEDPWAWLRDRDDPDTIALPRGGERLRRRVVRAARQELTDDAVRARSSSRVQETDVAVPVRKDAWWYTTRTEEGLSYAIHCRGAQRARPRPTTCCSTRTSRPTGHDYFSLGAFEISPDHDLARVEQRRRRQRAVRRCASATSARAPTSTTRSTGTSSWGGVAWSADASHALLRHARRRRCGRSRCGATASARRRPTTCWCYEEDDERFFLGVELQPQRRVDRRSTRPAS